MPERDKFMSEQKISFMQQLDEWTTATMINPLHEAVMDGDSADCEATREQIKKRSAKKCLKLSERLGGQTASQAAKIGRNLVR